MSTTCFNTNKFDATKQPMFFGEPVNVARYDIQKYPIFEKLIDKQLSFFWRPEEVDISRDRRDFVGLSEAEQHMFLSNLKYQTLLDSVQGRSPNLALLPIVSLPELETWVETWTFSEAIHSRSYTHIIRNLVNNPSEVFDSIIETQEILDRAGSVTKYYDNLIDMNNEYSLYEDAVVTKNHKKALLLCLMAVNVLEAIRFYVSFACAFSFAERSLMEGNSKIVRLISRDECLAEGTEVLTPTGWVDLSEITTSDIVAQFDPKTSEVSFVKPARVIEYDVDEELVSFEGKNFSQLVTKNHRMYKRNEGSKLQGYIPELAETICYNSCNFYPVSGHNNSGVELTDFERLLIMTQADGHLSKRYTGVFCGTLPIKFSFSKERKIERAIKMFGRLGFGWRELKPSESSDPNRKTQRNFNIDVPVGLLKDLNVKDFSSWVDLSDKGTLWAEQFIEELTHWDGHVPRGRNAGNYRQYTTTKKVNTDIVQAVCTLANLLAVVTKREDNRSEAFSDVYNCFIHQRNENRAGCVKKEFVHYKGKVRCLSVPTQAFLIRYKGRVSVTGNCLHLVGTQQMLKLLISEDPVYATIFEESQEEFLDIFREAAEEEIIWCDYLFSKGPVLGLNAEMLKGYVKYLTNERTSALGMESIFEETPNPLPWMDNWLTSDSVQVAPQETEISSYLVGAVNSNIDEGAFDEFSL